MAITIECPVKAKIETILKEKKDTFLRIIVEKGGCAGTRFAACLSSKTEDDIEINCGDDGFILLTNKESLPFLEDITVSLGNDLSEDIIVRNNLAKRVCRCGQSFSATG
jgi:iron-sulfur cluster assembly accessory protein